MFAVFDTCPGMPSKPIIGLRDIYYLGVIRYISKLLHGASFKGNDARLIYGPVPKRKNIRRYSIHQKTSVYRRNFISREAKHDQSVT